MAYIEAADLDILLRAFAHRAMFGLLALCVFMCLRQLFTRNRVILPATFFILLAAACADELHQLVSVGRGARVSDVVTDMQGVLFVIILSVLAQAVKKRRVTRAGKDRAAGNTHQT